MEAACCHMLSLLGVYGNGCCSLLHALASQGYAVMGCLDLDVVDLDSILR